MGGNLEYGTEAATLLVMAILMFVFNILFVKFYKQGKIDLQSPVRIWILRIVAGITSLNAIFETLKIISGFFRGNAEFPILLESLIMIILALLVLFYALGELRLTKIGGGFTKFTLFMFLALSVGGIALALYQAPPWLMREYRKDASVDQNIKNLFSLLNEEYKKIGVLPKTLDDIFEADAASRRPINRDLLQKRGLSYEVLNERQFNLCANYAHDSRQSQRLYGRSRLLYFKSGRYCYKYTVDMPVKVEQCVAKCWTGYRRY